MAIAPRVASVLCLAMSAVPAQKARQQIHDVRDLLADHEGRWPAQAQDWDARLKALTELADAALRRRSKDCSVMSADDQYLAVTAGPEVQRDFRSTLMDLRRGMVRMLELQISVIRLPAPLAAANGFTDGKNKDVTADEVALLLRQVQAAHGVLANLPEIRTRTLHAFDMPVPSGRATAGDRADPRLVVRGQLLPMDNVGAVRLELWEQGEQGVPAKDAPLASFVTALEMDKGVLLARVQGEQALLLWVWITAALEAANAKAPAADPGKK